MTRRYASLATQFARQQAALARQQVALARSQAAAERANLIADQRAERANQLAYAEKRQKEADDETAAVEAKVSAIESLLTSRFGNHRGFDFDVLKERPLLPAFNAQGLDQPLPEVLADLLPGPNFIQRIIPALMRRYEAAFDVAMRERDAQRATHAALIAERQGRLAGLRAQHAANCDKLVAQSDAANKQIDEFREDYKKRLPEAVDGVFEMVLASDPLPEGFPVSARVAYVADSKQLVVEREMPDSNIIPECSSYRYVKSADKIEPKARPANQRHAMYTSLVAKFPLETANLILRADFANAVDVLVLNCMVDTIDLATGKRVRPCLLSLRTTRDTFDALDLSKVDPVVCLRSLGARVPSSAHELMAVQPVVHFDMVDPRFVDKREVLSGLDERPNLAELSPSDFEALMTNLFEKMGLETRLTRPSRDGGVDCVAYDQRAILGGKVVIQAKRYRNTVGVSAVRDLYGTMMNEGATKGILVATSGYGKSAYEFASNKPLELITGENLLYLLQQFADVHAKIEFPLEWVDPTMDAPEPPEERVPT